MELPKMKTRILKILKTLNRIGSRLDIQKEKIQRFASGSRNICLNNKIYY